MTALLSSYAGGKAGFGELGEQADLMRRTAGVRIRSCDDLNWAVEVRRSGTRREDAFKTWREWGILASWSQEQSMFDMGGVVSGMEVLGLNHRE